ncbi:dGTPase [Aliarcobacter butzleri]|uniref:dGTPase n=1 Tax=Aliarcobacter butzleri TaxID=28197 RepID=UPI000658BA6B|nr:dGTPase [Aliarcobacter butzleri]KLE05048.1 deoxyguanosinetriphosphate triphosphohydrolase [Aliarcobacter butzleri L353]MCG3712332.1 dGTPase [Aliarcobacter butzleri]MCT7565303.1 dGTPase [Aliarcobacter butzleri]MCT7604718.1 dGTPase [Aliarcobacter butzleri]
MIDYKEKFILDREFYPSKDIEITVESDRGRIFSSSAFRRLQKRTQVFALELNASIRSRLTHSMEVSQNARFIARTILAELKKEGLEKFGLTEFENAFISTSEMTSLLHDIGNPPFGHFAEETINKWLKMNVLPILDKFEASTNELKNLKELISKDICNYDGNAQAIRIITKLQRLNLSYFQIISVLKYTRGAFEEKLSKEENLSYLKKKPGFYFSEKDLVEKIQKSLKIEAGHRFPITYIMEAADDISYLTADLEDSVKKGILSLDEVYNIIKKECQKEKEEFLLGIIEKQYEKAKSSEEPYQFNMFFTFVRVGLVTNFVNYVSKVFVQNHEAIFKGSFNYALLEFDKQSEYYKTLKILQDISTKYIYQNAEVQTLELQAYTIINSLFEIYKPLLELDEVDFSKLLKDEKIDCFISRRLIKRISKKQIVAYKNDIEKLDKQNLQEYKILEFYFRVRLIIDYISGMTDDFALEEYKVLLAMK